MYPYVTQVTAGAHSDPISYAPYHVSWATVPSGPSLSVGHPPRLDPRDTGAPTAQPGRVHPRWRDSGPRLRNHRRLLLQHLSSPGAHRGPRIVGTVTWVLAWKPSHPPQSPAVLWPATATHPSPLAQNSQWGQAIPSGGMLWGVGAMPIMQCGTFAPSIPGQVEPGCSQSL